MLYSPPNPDRPYEEVEKYKPYSPFRVSPSNKVEYVIARVDDFVNWARKVGDPFSRYIFLELDLAT